MVHDAEQLSGVGYYNGLYLVERNFNLQQVQ